jgi:DNA-binding PadR family transcriptional regulator
MPTGGLTGSTDVVRYIVMQRYEEILMNRPKDPERSGGRRGRGGAPRGEGCGATRFKFGGHGSGEGGRGHSPGCGRGHGHGQGRGPWSRARRGDVRAAILIALTDEPMHGYQIMQRLEERSGGAWRPSPGSVYPTLQLLEDQGLVRGEEDEGKRVFSLTEAGAAEAAGVKERLGGSPWGAEGGEQDPRFALRQAVFQLGAAVKQVGTAGSAADVQQALDILREARKRMYALLADAE